MVKIVQTNLICIFCGSPIVGKQHWIDEGDGPFHNDAVWCIAHLNAKVESLTQEVQDLHRILETCEFCLQSSIKCVV